MATLSVDEYQRILAVLKRDATLRKLEQERINKLRSSLQSDSEDSGCSRCVSPSSQRKCSTCVKHRELTLQTGDWFYRQLQGRFSRNNNNNSALENGEAMDPESTQVREFIERLVEALVEGQLDDVKVNRLYSHPEYDRMFSCHHSVLCETLVRLSFALQMAMSNKPLSEEESPSAVHTRLKQRVQDIIQEAMTLPNLKSQVLTQNNNATHKWDDDITSKSYEDILATAILNKVIEQFQQRTGIVLRDGNSNLLQHRSAASPDSMDSSSKYISQVEIGVNGPSSLDDGDTSSLEGIRSWSESSHTEPVSMTIEECIEEEVTTYNSEGEEEDEETRPASELDFYLSGLNFIKQRRVPFPELGVDIVHGDEEEEEEDCESPQPTDLVSPVDSWEENWLFQRRRLKFMGSSQNNPMPVPMLVPNPSEEYRALIGDRDAEEVSDLSDCSDGALEDVVLAGVETTETNVDVTDGASIEVSTDVTTQQTYQNHEEEEEEHQNEVVQEPILLVVPEINAELVKTSSMECLSEFGQQDSEYTEDYASVTQRQLSSLTLTNEPVVPVPKPRSHLPQQVKPEPEVNNMEDSEFSTPPRPGTIAEREHRKWQSAVPLPNNPYSPENISKRLNRRSSDLFNYSASRQIPELTEEPVTPAPLQVVCTSSEPDYQKYGRDYYINQSKCASGAKRSPPQKSVEIVETEQDSGVDTSDTSQLGGHVEIEVARWQKGIDQTEQQWLSKMSTKQNNSASHNRSSPINQNNSSPIQNGLNKSSIIIPRDEKQLESDWNTAPSECSTVSSDLDLDADVPVVLPSVKELAKQFSGGATSDSDTSLHKAVPSFRRKVESQKKPVDPPRPYLSEEKREIHSLTARSISREFREGLRRNLPTRLDRNVHGKTDSTSSSPEPVNCGEETKAASDLYRAKPVNGGLAHDTTPGYTSDESGTRSPSPPFDGRRKLQSNIAFWEKMSGK